MGLEQRQVHDHHIRHDLLRRPQRLLHIRGFSHNVEVALRRQKSPQAPAEKQVGVCQQDFVCTFAACQRDILPITWLIGGMEVCFGKN
jgi:hypothetical protein